MPSDKIETWISTNTLNPSHFYILIEKWKFLSFLEILLFFFLISCIIHQIEKNVYVFLKKKINATKSHKLNEKSAELVY